VSFISKLFGINPKHGPRSSEQAVIVHLDGQNLPNDVYEKYDLSTLEDQLTHAIAQAKCGEFDGNEFGPTSTALYMYGPDAERLFTTVEPVLKNYPLCSRATIVVRKGPPGSEQREIRLS
jgi:hypothetical protein